MISKTVPKPHELEDSQPSSPKPLRDSSSTLSHGGVNSGEGKLVLGIPLSPSHQGNIYRGKSMTKRKYMVFRFDDGRVRAFKEAGTFEVIKRNGVVFGEESHFVEVPHIEGETRRRVI